MSMFMEPPAEPAERPGDFPLALAPSEPASVVRERVARAIYAEGAWCGDCEYDGWDTCAECRKVALRYADAAAYSGSSKADQ